MKSLWISQTIQCYGWHGTYFSSNIGLVSIKQPGLVIRVPFWGRNNEEKTVNLTLGTDCFRGTLSLGKIYYSTPIYKIHSTQMGKNLVWDSECLTLFLLALFKCSWPGTDGILSVLKIALANSHILSRSKSCVPFSYLVEELIWIQFQCSLVFLESYENSKFPQGTCR